MSAAQEFRDAVRRYTYDFERPAGEDMWSPRLEQMPRPELEQLQSHKLAAAYRYLYENSAYYRERFRAAGLGPTDVRGLADLRRVPITRKHDWIPTIESHPPWGTFSPLTDERWASSAWMIFSTSGTTRRPRVFRHTSFDRETWSWMCARALWSYGIRPGQVAMNCFYYGSSVAAWGMHHGLERLGCALVPGGPMPTERRAFFIETLRPQVLLGTPSGLLSLARRLTELHGDARTKGVRTLVCAGEAGAAVPATRARLEQAWGAEVHDDFGCTEAAQAPLGFTCRHAVQPDGTVDVHLMEDAHIVEVVDPVTYEPVPEGQRGILVVSNLYSEGGPHLRFEVGDWVQVTRTPCRCGRTFARVQGGLLGRDDHCLKIKGLQFFPGTFEDVLRAIPGVGDEYRIEVLTGDGATSGRPESSVPSHRLERDHVRIVTEPAPGASLAVEEIGARLRGLLGIQVEVQLLPTGTLPRTEGKGQRFFDRRAENTRKEQS